jgi:hypothetical protein
MKREHLAFAPALFCTVMFFVTMMSGCEKDARIKREASYVNTVTQVAAKEFKAAPTPTEKAKVAEAFFRRIPKHTQNLEDYLHGKKPSGPSPEEVKKEREKAEAVDVPGREGIGNE